MDSHHLLRAGLPALSALPWNSRHPSGRAFAPLRAEWHPTSDGFRTDGPMHPVDYLRRVSERRSGHLQAGGLLEHTATRPTRHVTNMARHRGLLSLSSGGPSLVENYGS